MDMDRTGLINADELKQAIMNNKDISISEQEITNIIAEVDYFGNSKINYSEFIVATLDLDEFLDDNKLMALFN
jgi:Ca2+-binding EF-hand superfamily protein